MRENDGLFQFSVKAAFDAVIKFVDKGKPKLRAQFKYCDKVQIPYVVTLGPDEWKEGLMRVKPQVGKDKATGEGEKVKLDKLATWLKERM